MALEHAHPLQAVDLAPLNGALAEAATHAILKTPTVELIRVVLRAGMAMPVHRVVGDITLQCLEGSVDVTLGAGAAPCRLQPQQLVLIPGGQPHGVTALRDASLLLTITVPKGAPGSASSTAG